MSKHLHLQPLAGASGDMFLALLLDLGWSESSLTSMPQRLGLERVTVRVENAMRAALAAKRVVVLVDGEDPDAHAHAHAHHGHDHHAHDHHHHEGHDHDDHHAHGHAHGKTLAAMLKVVEDADVPVRAKLLARDAIERLFAAESAVHGEPADKIHLHEAGGEDALVDIVGTCTGIVELDITSVSCETPLPLGGGHVHCAHGTMPVPAPAVVRLLEGVKTKGGPVDFELITPTGAALLRALVDQFGPSPSSTIRTAGFGAGGRDMPQLSNVLSGFLADPAIASGHVHRRLSVLECTVDDMNPQDVPSLIDRALDAGARDAFVEAVQMKKGRPGFRLTVICDPERAAALANVVLTHSSTLGVRMREESRLEWRRDVIEVSTEFGPVRVKRALDAEGQPVRAQAEFDDLQRLALAADVTIESVRRAAHAALALHMQEEGQRR